MERTHRKLRTRFSYGLSGYDTNSLADVDRISGRKVRTVAVGTYAVFCLALEYRANVHAFYSGADNRIHLSLAQHIAVLCENLAGIRMSNIADNISSEQTVAERLNNVVALHDIGDPHSLSRSAVLLADDNVLRNVDQTPREVTGVGCLKRRVRKRLARAARRNEIIKYIQTLAEV